MGDILHDIAMSGWDSTKGYLAEHVLTCLVPAFFIAGAIVAFVKKEGILKYLGPKVDRRISYPLAAVSGAVLAVCSCTILPIFAGIYKRGSGIGPATAFLYSGPAINILAVIYTARVLGYDLGAARASAAVTMSVVIGLLMATVFRSEGSSSDGADLKVPVKSYGEEIHRPRWVLLAFFASLVAILVISASGLGRVPKISAVLLLIIGVAYMLVRHFQKEEVAEWGYETWDLTKKIFPVLIAGTFAVGVIAYFLPPETFRPYLGGNSVWANFLAAVIGAILYMPTLLEVPIVGTTFGYTSGVIGGGPALALLLSGPAVSLPSMLVLYRIVGARKAGAYIALVTVISTFIGFVYGNLIA